MRRHKLTDLTGPEYTLQVKAWFHNSRHHGRRFPVARKVVARGATAGARVLRILEHSK